MEGLGARVFQSAVQGVKVGVEAEAREYSAFEELKKIDSDECKELSVGG